MNVFAFTSPYEADWRWRIVDYGGEMLEESSMGFSTIALAVAAGSARLQQRIDRDRPPSVRALWPGRR